MMWESALKMEEVLYIEKVLFLENACQVIMKYSQTVIFFLNVC
jgi:hypothetical protein